MNQESNEKPPKLSLQEKMQLSLNDSARLFQRTKAVILGSFLFLLVAVLVSALFFTVVDLYGSIHSEEDCETDAFIFQNFQYQPKEGCYDFVSDFNVISSGKFVGLLYLFHQIVDGLILLVMIMLGGMIIWWILKGGTIHKRMNQIKRQYTTQAYYFTLQTSLHGDNIVEDFFDIALEIFPEIKDEEIKSIQKTGNELEIQSTIIEKHGNYELDIEQPTKEGHFLVKNFQSPKVSFNEVEGLVKIVKDEYGKDKLLRLVCLAKSFDRSIIEKYEELKVEKNFLDLIEIRDKGFRVISLGK